MRGKLLFLIPALLLTSAGTKAQAPASALENKIDSIFAQVTQKDSPGLAALVRKDGKTVFEQGYGVRDLRTMAKIDAHTNFRLASFTKQFTAMAIMLLIHYGKLHYDDKLGQIFPEFPAYGKDITIRNLLNHTSGLPDYEDLMDAAEKANGPTWSRKRRRDSLPREQAGLTAIPATLSSAWLSLKFQENLSATFLPSVFSLRCTWITPSCT